MNFDELIHGRYSCRKFSDKPVEEEKLNTILEAGMAAPTAVNFQPQRFYVIKSAEALAKVSKCTKYAFNPAVNILICYDSTVSWHRGMDGKDHGEIDASIAATHMMLKAWDMGIGSTWVSSFSVKDAREQFGLPENIVPIAFLPLGYPAEDAVPAKQHTERRDFSETTKYL